MTAWKPEVLSGYRRKPQIAVVQVDPLRLQVCGAADAIAIKASKWLPRYNILFPD